MQGAAPPPYTCCMGTVLVWLVLAGLLLLFVATLIRRLLSAAGLGAWACAKGWHLVKYFPLHTRQGLTGRTTTYLAVAGIKIGRCTSCGRFSPPEGRVVYDQWVRGGIASAGGGVFSDPKVKADPEAARAVGATLATSLAVAPPRKPKSPPARWKVVVGSWSVVQVLGKYILLVAGVGMVICFVGLLSARNDRAAVEMLLGAAGLGGLAWLVAGLMEAGITRHISRNLAAEAARDPLGYHERSAEFARTHGTEMPGDEPADVTPESLAETARRRAEKE
jgi:hypothetical protein